MKKSLFPCLVAMPSFVLLLLAVSSPALASGYTGIRITNASPIDINCGSSVVVTVEISYYRDSGDTDPHSVYLRLYQYNSYWFDDQLHVISVNMPGTPGNGKFTVDFTIKCDTQNPNGKCKFFAGEDAASGESPHQIYAYLFEQQSTKVTVNCKKSTGALAYVRPQQDPIHPTEATAVTVAIASPTTPVSDVNLLIRQNQRDLSLFKATFDANFLALCRSTKIDSAAGRDQIRFTAHLSMPHLFVDPMTIASYTLRSNYSTPYGPYLINIDTSSRLLDARGQMIDAHLGAQILGIVPSDKEPPSINSGLITTCGNTLVGNPGAIRDNFLNLDGYVHVSLFDRDSLGIGGAKVNTDGSFRMDGLHLYNGESLKLTTMDFAGNSSFYRYTANALGTGQCPVPLYSNPFPFQAPNNTAPVKMGPSLTGMNTGKLNEIDLLGSFMRFGDKDFHYNSWGFSGEYTHFCGHHPRIGTTFDAGYYWYSEGQSDSKVNYGQLNLTAGITWLPCRDALAPTKQFAFSTHALAGISLYREKFNTVGSNPTSGTTYTYTQTNTTNSFTANVGAAIDWKLNPSFKIRLFQADYTPTFFFKGTQNNYRLSAGVGFKF